jgi:DNA-directed RNA polymerase subunit RPC12/RpoP
MPLDAASVEPVQRKFPCERCGARLDFDPSKSDLKCPYCGNERQIWTDYTAVEERDFAAAIEAGNSNHRTIAGRSAEVHCGGCGAIVLLEDNVATDRCPFCATHLENPPVEAQAMIAPESVLPFAVDYRDAKSAFEKWISERWFAPSGLKQLANLGQLNGIYVPFWTYDAMTYTHYTGQRGEEQFDGVSAADGFGVVAMMAMNNRSRRRMVWKSVAGEVHHFFDDSLICASTSIPLDKVMQLQPWDLENLVGFKPDYLSGFKTQRYAITLKDGFELAKVMMEPMVKELCREDIGGDVQILETWKTSHERVTFKHVLLPVWLASCRYYNRTYQIMVNARTGEVVGDRPWSLEKIGFLSFLLLALAGLVLYLTQ